MFAKIFVTVVVLLMCADTSSCASKSEDQRKDQYAAPSKDTTSTTTTRTTKTSMSDDKSEIKPLETMYGDQPPRVPLRHHRAGSKGSIKKLRSRNYESLWQDPTESLPPAYFYSSWTPATYTLNRPYYIPAWGPVGGVPIYFPPQPLLVNPGYPPINPPQPNREYLPPYENPPAPTTAPPSAPDFEISNKFGDGDDAPVWDLADTPPQINRKPSGGSRIPTRRPRPPNPPTSTFPSVVHRPTTEEANGINSLSASKENEKNKSDAGYSVAGSPPATNAPGRCVWAIISCCSGASQDVTNVCFEQLGCSGPFWDKSPCDSEFAKAAINAALEFYKTGK
ncbi:proline-rich extensin-like protein EPR1 [Agrilus planipennis]|uniref:Proline-rich extensin-like protein EPR1 n=1 Tax=Agrilus planipennis TaxID=224129 RepID=A0A7F5R365_AGRPL|nr:proline-rich extensin-like protein EPR1 [Agrilus planipennis]XP_025829649.1 proline-rich extensin-like protein EPR1 [Agrilus planipennis]XP_025829650.1 proline-rich extensin-like protein EPR1 [Agrilus planipennis]XP_025829651.1 proline-rich extensin-like protein EPR1 [Agrilus planipennis]XP_025829652.1 proline-rich extensin-like protein EPR1 [Agrilus planipennis]